jgi:hypothetical protein
MENIKSYVQENKDRLSTINRIIKNPSVSADTALSRCFDTSEAVK